MRKQKSGKPHRWVVLLTIAAVFAAFLSVCLVNTDPDFGWHLRSGELIASSGVPKHDPYSFTMSGFEWVNHEWLSDLISHWIYSAGGMNLIGVFYAALWTVAVAVALRKRWWYGFSLALLGTMPQAGPRPLVWTAIGIALTEWIIDKHIKNPDVGWAKLLPVIFLGWANLHGGFAFGLVLLAVHTIFRRDKKLAFAGILSALLTLLNPYGVNIYTEIFRTILDNKLGTVIMEWMPLPALSTSSFVFRAVVVFLALSLVMMWFGKLKFRSYKTYIPLVAALMMLGSNRHLLLFVFTSARYSEAGAEKLMNLVKGWWKLVPIGLLLIPILMSLYYRIVPSLRERPELSNWLSETVYDNCHGNIFNDYNVGGYLIWKNPEVAVYIDGRMPSWKNSEGRVFDRYVRFQDNKQYRDSEIKRYDIQCLVLSNIRNNNDDLIVELKGSDWQGAGVRGNVQVLRK